MKTAFSAFIFGDYQKFIPFYIYSIIRNYPNSDVIIFYQGMLSESVKMFAKKYRQVIIYEEFYKEQLGFKKYRIKNGGGYKLLRFLIPFSYFENYDYVYFGDIDILILGETQSLFEFHKKQAIKSNVPFSNKVRQTPNGLSKRITGLHFVEVKPYFDKIQPIIMRILADNIYRDQFINKLERDEEFLYKLNKEAFDFDEVLISKNERPWHGFHLGLVRGKSYLNETTILENSSISIEDLKTQLEDLDNHGVITRLLLEIDCVEVYHTFKYFNLRLPNRVKFKYEFSNIRKKAFNLLKKIKINTQFMYAF